MKKIMMIAVFALLLGAMPKSETNAKPFNGGVTFGYFYNTLSPYGEWIEVDINVFAWRPYNVSYNWQPYMEGRWVWTSDGWFWDSYEPFGWATYHYGRWYFDDYYGWIWLPGYEWAPAWVEWRYNDSYIGWAPLPPYAAYRHGSGIHFSITWNSPYRCWTYVSYGHFHSHNIYHYVVAPHEKYRIHSRTKYRTNYYERGGRIVNGGIDRGTVERHTGRRVNERTIERSNDLKYVRDNEGRGNSDRIVVHRPTEEVVRNNSNVDRVVVSRSEGRSSLKTDRITERRETEIAGRKEYSDRSNNVRQREERSGSESGRSVFPETRSDSRTREYVRPETRRTAPPTSREKGYIPDRGSSNDRQSDRRQPETRTKRQEIRKETPSRQQQIFRAEPERSKQKRTETTRPSNSGSRKESSSKRESTNSSSRSRSSNSGRNTR